MVFVKAFKGSCNWENTADALGAIESYVISEEMGMVSCVDVSQEGFETELGNRMCCGSSVA